MPIDVPELTPDTVFDALGNQRRRFALAYLRQQNRPVALTELARKIAGWETEGQRSEADEETRRRVGLSLYHVHLPKLAELGLVEYTDDDRRTVEPTNRIRTLEANLDFEALVEPREYYVG